MRIDVVLLQPPKIEYSVMGQPVSDWTAEEAAELSPVTFIKFKAINKDNSITHARAKLQKTQFVALGLYLERFCVKANRSSGLNFV
jgi:hypothetical protein